MRSLGGDTPLETCLAEARQAGYAGIELGNKFPRWADRLKPILERHGLSLISGWYGARLLERGAGDEIATMADHLSLLEAMGCRVMVFAETSNAVHGNQSRPAIHRPVLADDQWDRFAERLNVVADHMANRGRVTRLPPPHGNGDRDPRRDRPPDGHYREVGRSAAGYGPRGLCGCRSSIGRSASCGAYRPHPLQGCPAGGAGRRVRRRRQLPRCRRRGGVHGSRRRRGGFPRRARRPRRGRLRRLAGGRGRTGPRQGAPADLRHHGFREPRRRGRPRWPAVSVAPGSRTAASASKQCCAAAQFLHVNNPCLPGRTVPATLGACAANSERRAVALCGDYDFQL